MQSPRRSALALLLALATGCDRSDLVASRVREPDAGTTGGASARTFDASLPGSGGAGATAAGSGGVGGGSSGSSGGGVPTAGGGGSSGNGGGDASVGSGDGSIGSGGSAGAGDAGARDAGTDSRPSMDSGAPDGGLDAWVPQTCTVGSVPTRAGCEPVPVASKVSVGFVPCRVRADGTLWCWGAGLTQWSPSWQEPPYETQVGSASDWTSVTVGSNGICGIRAPGTIWCWGRLIVAGASGGATTQSYDQPVQVGVEDDWHQVAAGFSGFCGIKQNGTLWCWGSVRALTPSTPAVSSTPIQVGTDSNWSMVSTNSAQTCAIRTNGSLECFGVNDFGRLGDGTTTDHGNPVPILEPGPWVSVAVGSDACAVRFDGTLWCWGYAFGSSPVPADAATDWTTIVAGGTTNLVCGLRAGGRLMCRDPYASSRALTQTDSELGYTSVAAGCAEHQDGTLRCWGYPAFGDGSHWVEPEPVRVGTATDWTSIVLSGQAEMGLRAGGVLESRVVPTAVSGTWLELSLGASANGCAIRADHTLWCWGSTWVEQGPTADWLDVTLGYESGESACAIREGGVAGQGTLWCSHQPGNPASWRQADSRTDWVSLSRSRGVCGIHADGSLTCWTYPGSDPVLTDIGTDHDWASVSAPQYAQCAIKTDASLWCWGGNANANAWGQLGDGTRTDSPVPEHIAPGTHWAEVAAGNYASCGIQTDGSLWCWGLGGNGELGLGVPGTQRLVPTRVGSALDWEHVAVSGWGGINAYACGIRSGELWCWGSNGQVGHVSWSPVFTPTPRVVVDPPPPGGGQFCPWPDDGDLDGYAACLGDCDDKNPDVNPSAVERCNGIDDDCNGTIDEGCP